MEKVDPRVLRISFCHLQASHSPAFTRRESNG
jgi:hypothetical protein